MNSGRHSEGGGFAPPCTCRRNPLAPLFFAGLLAFIVWAVLGTPYLRVSYSYRPSGAERVYVSARYLSFADSFEASPSELGRDTCPLVVFVMPDKPLLQRLFGSETGNPASATTRDAD